MKFFALINLINSPLWILDTNSNQGSTIKGKKTTFHFVAKAKPAKIEEINIKRAEKPLIPFQKK